MTGRPSTLTKYVGEATRGDLLGVTALWPDPWLPGPFENFLNMEKRNVLNFTCERV